MQRSNGEKCERCRRFKFLCFAFFVCILIVLLWFFLPRGLYFPDKTAKIDALIQKTLPNASIGIVVLDAESGKTVFAQNADALFLPASNAKILTTAAALEALGPTYRFETSLKMDSANQLYLQFSGDPSFSTADLKALIAEMKTLEMQKITGDLIVEESRFKPPYYPLGWTWDDLMWYYGAPVTTVILNENQIKLDLTAGRTLGETATVTLATDESAKVKVSSEVITVSKEMASKECQFQMQKNAQNDIQFSGCWPLMEKPFPLKVAVENPLTLLEQNLLDIFKAQGIEFSGKIISGTLPKAHKTLSTHFSKPLGDLIKTVLEDSNNLYAESILKTLGAERFQQGSFSYGLLAMKQILEKMTSIDFSKVRISDGSGLSRNNAISPNQLAAVLYSMSKNEKVGETFMAAFPIGRENGTLRDRLKAPEVKGRVRAKTGTLQEASTLSGYLKAQNGKDLIFVIMVEHVTEGGARLAEEVEDELCRLFVVTNW